MDLRLKGQHVLVTGGSKGIGAACARIFLQEGCSVTIVSRDSQRLEATRDELAAIGPVTAFAADLSQGSERERVAAAHPNTTILVNNAGAIPGGGLLDLTMEKWQEAWNLKVMGYIHLTQLLLGRMKERKAGTIVKILKSGYDRAEVAEYRGPLGPKGVRIYRVLVQKKPRRDYIEVREDQLEVLSDGQGPNRTGS